MLNWCEFPGWCLGNCFTNAGRVVRARRTMPLPWWRILQGRGQAIHMPTSVASVAEEYTGIIAFFLTNFTCLAFDALPGVGADEGSDCVKIHASGMATTATLVTRDHLLRLTSLVLLVIPVTEAAIWLSAYFPLLLWRLCGEYGLSDRREILWWGRLSKWIALGTLRIFADLTRSIRSEGQGNVILV